MTRPNYFVLTGAMGAGKSAVLERLRAAGQRCVDDPARQILKEQRSIGGQGVPEVDAVLFNQLMLSRAIHVYVGNAQAPGAIVFDRGIPDLVAYAGLFGISAAVYERAAATYRYNATAFYFAGWREIYAVDDERKMDYESAGGFGENAARAYERLGYRTGEVPRIPLDERVRFILDVIGRAQPAS